MSKTVNINIPAASQLLRILGTFLKYILLWLRNGGMVSSVKLEKLEENFFFLGFLKIIFL